MSRSVSEDRSEGGRGPVENSPPRPKLLFLCQTLPYPPDGGVHLRAYNIMRLLSHAFDVTALCFYRAASRGTAEEVEASLDGLRRITKRVRAFPIPQDESRLRFVWDHLRSVLTGRVYTRFVYESGPFEKAVEEELGREAFDIVHVDSLDLSGYLPLLRRIPVVCTHHNVESALLRRRAETERFPMDAYLRLQARLMEKEERRAGPLVNLNVVVSEPDAQRLEAIDPETPITIVPNGVDTTYFSPRDPGADGVVFVGGYSWYPNKDALEYFAASILPLLRRVDPDVHVTWIGDAPAEVRERFEREHGIELTGYVDDIRPLVDDAGCYVVPLRVGGGTRLKILDAWAMGKAVVSTSIGCEGLETRDGENILVRDDPHRFADAVIEVLENRVVRDRLSTEGRRTARTVYEWEVIAEDMLDEYHELIRPS